MDNILEGRAEVDRVIYSDTDPETGFLLLPDLKWSQENTDDLYVLAIVRKKGILCLRELNASHLPLLESVYEKAKVVCMCMSVHVRMFLCVYVCLCLCMHVCVFMQLCMCLCVYICIHV